MLVTKRSILAQVLVLVVGVVIIYVVFDIDVLDLITVEPGTVTVALY
jgi:hypothetical protein